MTFPACLAWMLVSLHGAGQAAPAPAEQYAFEIELWPGEGRPVFAAAATDLLLRREPQTRAPVAERLAVTRDQTVEFGQTVYRTLKPGRLRALKDVRLTGRGLGTLRRLSREAYYRGRFENVEFALRAGDSILFLQERAEGTCFVSVGDAVVDVERCPTLDVMRYALESKPELEWWIEVLVDNQPRGWLMVGDKTVKEVDRRF